MQVEKKLDLSHVAEKCLHVHKLIVSLHWFTLSVNRVGTVPDQLLDHVERLDNLDTVTTVLLRVLIFEQLSHAVLALVFLISSGGDAINGTHDLRLHSKGSLNSLDQVNGLNNGVFGLLELLIEANELAVDEVELCCRDHVHLIRLISLTARGRHSQESDQVRELRD